MSITMRLAQKQDIPAILQLLNEVLEVHAAIRPDIFIPNTTKYQYAQLSAMINDQDKPIIVACDELDQVVGYAFCLFEKIDHPFMHQRKLLYVDDICVNKKFQHQHIGTMIFTSIKQLAITHDCDTITLNVWEGNDQAWHFYQKMGMTKRKTMLELNLK
ncbi:MAG: GNAT family N-acetyltransferase [Erysipelotrichaceae bacterium]|nr:GNAT family N-acetyltransferase [Erysipelotrichaceae bacterium]MDY5252165.1 GNAT family N-acetyltransferase [Erysipelotrichaceae bacterium]